MRKITTTLLVVFAFATMSFAQTYSDDERAIAAARAEVQSTCLVGAGEIQVYVTQGASCDNSGGVIRTVTFYDQPKCPPNMICPLFFWIRNLATVTVDCDFNVVDARCGWFFIQ